MTKSLSVLFPSTDLCKFTDRIILSVIIEIVDVVTMDTRQVLFPGNFVVSILVTLLELFPSILRIQPSTTQFNFVLCKFMVFNFTSMNLFKKSCILVYVYWRLFGWLEMFRYHTRNGSWSTRRVHHEIHSHLCWHPCKQQVRPTHACLPSISFSSCLSPVRVLQLYEQYM